jgi:hypothetical protein
MASALVADPTTQQQAAITGNFLLALTVVLIFATGLDHMTLKGLAGTYAIFPAGEVPPMGDVANHAARIVSDSFAVAIAMTAPFLVYGIVFAVALGLLARLMPTLQVFFIAMPMQLLAGLALMAVALTSMMLYFLSPMRSGCPYSWVAAEPWRKSRTTHKKPKTRPVGELDEARKRGQVANSREVNNLLMLGVFSMSILLFGGTAASAIYKATMPFIESPTWCRRTSSIWLRWAGSCWVSCWRPGRFPWRSPSSPRSALDICSSAWCSRPTASCRSWTRSPRSPASSACSPCARWRSSCAGC